MSVTITGCVLMDNPYWHTRKRIKIQSYTIGDCPVCNSKSPTYACGIVTEGDHKGQVSVTFTGGLCDDTYYGCYDPVSGQFKIEVPQSCPMPTLNLQFADLQDVDCMQCGNPPASNAARSKSTGIAAVVNGQHTLEYVGNCVYEKYIPISDFIGSWIWGLAWNNEDCDPDPNPPDCNQPPVPSNQCYRIDRFHSIRIRATLGSSGITIVVSADFASFWYSRGNCLCNAVYQGLDHPYDIESTPCNEDNYGYEGYKMEGGVMQPGSYRCNSHGRPPNTTYTWDYYAPSPDVGVFSCTIPYNSGENCGKTQNNCEHQSWIGCTYEPVAVGGTVNVVY
jgi:hypothetical protein